MKTSLIYLGSSFGVAALSIMTATAIGFSLPAELTATRTARFTQPPEVLWKTITDHAAEPTWQAQTRSIQRLPDQNGHPVWREIFWNYQKVNFETIEQSAGGVKQVRAWQWNGKQLVLQNTIRESSWRLTRHLAYDGLPVVRNGKWTIEIKRDKGGSLVTMSEEKTVAVPPFRTLARLFVLPQLKHITVDRYLHALGSKLGNPPQLI